MLWWNGLKIRFNLALDASDMSSREPYEAFAWHSAAPRQSARTLLIAVLCAVCGGAGYMMGQAKSEAVDGLAVSVSSADQKSYASSASSLQSDLDQATRQASSTASTPSSTLQKTPETDAARVVLLNPHSAGEERESERKSERSGLTVVSQRLNRPISEIAPAARKRKKASLPRRQEQSSNKPARASPPDPVSDRAQSRNALSFKQDPPLRDYRDLREQLFK
jgi:hypothetical protein